MRWPRGGRGLLPRLFSCFYFGGEEVISSQWKNEKTEDSVSFHGLAGSPSPTNYKDKSATHIHLSRRTLACSETCAAFARSTPHTGYMPVPGLEDCCCTLWTATKDLAACVKTVRKKKMTYTNSFAKNVNPNNNTIIIQVLHVLYSTFLIVKGVIQSQYFQYLYRQEYIAIKT